MGGTPEARALDERLRAMIAARGPLPFSTWMERCLYEPDLGFYAAGGAAGGRQGDFVTSVETGPLFAALIGEWLDRRWQACGRPDPFLVAEAAAGVGTLWRGIRRARPVCFDALQWTLVERSARLRGAHAELPAGRWSSREDLPATAQHVVLANELLDNLAFDIAVWHDGGWQERRVGLDGESFAFVPGPMLPPSSPLANLAPASPSAGTSAGPDTSVPVASGAVDWLARARAIAEVTLVFDYGATTAELAARGQQGWLRTYAAHARASDPLAAPGGCDITHDVPFDQLPTAREAHSQADWLREHGLESRVEQARATWQNRAAIGDLEAMFARSAIGEAEALSDPTGLGGFSVLEW